MGTVPKFLCIITRSLGQDSPMESRNGAMSISSVFFSLSFVWLEKVMFTCLLFSLSFHLLEKVMFACLPFSLSFHLVREGDVTCYQHV